VPDNLNLGIATYSNFTTTRFLFDSPLSLTPGQLSVIELTQLPPFVQGNDNFLLYGGPLNASTYAQGDGIVNGTAHSGFDFAFSEGVVPEPSSIIGCAIALAVLACSGRRNDLSRR
jgi:hypothetical protein